MHYLPYLCPPCLLCGSIAHPGSLLCQGNCIHSVLSECAFEWWNANLSAARGSDGMRNTTVYTSLAHVGYVIAAECAMFSQNAPGGALEHPLTETSFTRLPISLFTRVWWAPRGAHADTEIAAVNIEQGHSHWMPQGCTGCETGPENTLA